VPDHMGPYRILEKLGEGGMGTVYLAEQREPVRRRVALKVVRRGMDSKQVLARFELERQALAVLNHPAIAKVFDARVTDQGQPYFAMELVEGSPITDYCDRNKLSFAQRIDVFQQVCHGVQHAHQKGILHRDLKPPNILVSRSGDQHIVKIIDFGLARATDQQLVLQTIFTEHGQLIGTPEYMSPEQVSGHTLEIDTRTDIYSLGVVLYELLTGDLPFSTETLREAGLLEIQRILREVEPPKPSTRFSSSGDRADEFAKKRATSLGAMRKMLHGDLDWIVMRALAKEPARRYESATSLAMDLQRYLDHEPVSAGPPSVRYRLGKLARRYRGQVLAAVLVLVVAIAGALVAWRQAVNAVAQTQRAEANVELAIEAVGEMLTRVGDRKLANTPHMDEVRRELLADALRMWRRLRRQEPDDPRVRRALANTLWRISCLYETLGETDAAEKQCRAAITMLEDLQAAYPGVQEQTRSDIATFVRGLGNLLQANGRDREASKAWSRSLTTFEDLCKEFPEQQMYQRKLISSYTNVAMRLAFRGRMAQAEKLTGRAVERASALAAERPDDASVLFVRARALHLSANVGAMSGLSAAVTIERYRAALAQLQPLLDKHPKSADVRRRQQRSSRTWARSVGRRGSSKQPTARCEQRSRCSPSCRRSSRSVPASRKGVHRAS